MMSTLAQRTTELIEEAATLAGFGDSPVPLEQCLPTNDRRHGDYQSNFAFRLGRALRTNPREVAAKIVAALPKNDIIEQADVAGPGFINLRVHNEWLGQHLLHVAQDEHLLTPQHGHGRTMVIDYSSPNIAKRLHIGHLRSTIIGNALYRLHAALGWKVVGDNHIGDWGTQFGKLIVAYREWGSECPLKEDPIGELQWMYQQFDVRAQSEPELNDRSREETVKLQAGEPENRELWQRFVKTSMAENQVIYDRLGICFDVTHGESFYNEALGPLVERLIGEGLAVESEGAIV
ncbi:MAG: arginine--tRNA ligase, partial [Proteobacteria bacterium]|nr:arginine--tRNA ligase [Pseudomonadota bacterium]